VKPYGLLAVSVSVRRLAMTVPRSLANRAPSTKPGQFFSDVSVPVLKVEMASASLVNIAESTYFLAAFRESSKRVEIPSKLKDPVKPSKRPRPSVQEQRLIRTCLSVYRRFRA